MPRNEWHRIWARNAETINRPLLNGDPALAAQIRQAIHHAIEHGVPLEVAFPKAGSTQPAK